MPDGDDQPIETLDRGTIKKYLSNLEKTEEAQTKARSFIDDVKDRELLNDIADGLPEANFQKKHGPSVPLVFRTRAAANVHTDVTTECFDALTEETWKAKEEGRVFKESCVNTAIALDRLPEREIYKRLPVIRALRERMPKSQERDLVGAWAASAWGRMPPTGKRKHEHHMKEMFADLDPGPERDLMTANMIVGHQLFPQDVKHETFLVCKRHYEKARENGDEKAERSCAFTLLSAWGRLPGDAAEEEYRLMSFSPPGGLSVLDSLLQGPEGNATAAAMPLIIARFPSARVDGRTSELFDSWKTKHDAMPDGPLRHASVANRAYLRSVWAKDATLGAQLPADDSWGNALSKMPNGLIADMTAFHTVTMITSANMQGGIRPQEYDALEERRAFMRGERGDVITAAMGKMLARRSDLAVPARYEPLEKRRAKLLKSNENFSLMTYVHAHILQSMNPQLIDPIGHFDPLARDHSFLPEGSDQSLEAADALGQTLLKMRDDVVPERLAFLEKTSRSKKGDADLLDRVRITTAKAFTALDATRFDLADSYDSSEFIRGTMSGDARRKVGLWNAKLLRSLSPEKITLERYKPLHDDTMSGKEKDDIFFHTCMHLTRAAGKGLLRENDHFYGGLHGALLEMPKEDRSYSLMGRLVARAFLRREETKRTVEEFESLEAVRSLMKPGSDLYGMTEDMIAAGASLPKEKLKISRHYDPLALMYEKKSRKIVFKGGEWKEHMDEDVQTKVLSLGFDSEADMFLSREDQAIRYKASQDGGKTCLIEKGEKAYDGCRRYFPDAKRKQTIVPYLGAFLLRMKDDPDFPQRWKSLEKIEKESREEDLAVQAPEKPETYEKPDGERLKRGHEKSNDASNKKLKLER